MKKCYEEISMYIENDLNISGSGVAILTTILGRMGDAENKEAFDTIKNVAETAVLRLRMDKIINTKEFNRLSELIDNCIFCDEDETSIDMTETTISETNEILNGMVLYNVTPLFYEDKQIGAAIVFHTNEQDEASKFRHLSVQYDGRLLISEEY